MRNSIEAAVCCGLLLLSGALTSCGGGASQEAAAPEVGLCPDSFGVAEVDGQQVKLFTLKNSKGCVAQFTNLGAKLVSLYMPDKQGALGDVVLGYATAAEYAKCDNAAGVGEPFFGACIGRYANRIAEGKFQIDGIDYQLDVNEGDGHLHGGKRGFYSRVWEVANQQPATIEFKLKAVDGEMGYPGNLDATVSYQLTDSNALVIKYSATTDKPTIINLTNHSFFNLAGEGDETINDEQIRILADSITPVNDKLIPTGELMAVDGTPFEFRVARTIGDSLSSQHPQMLLGHGYDHNFVLSDCPGECGLRKAAEVYDPQSGRVMEVLTDQPGIQFYAGNFLNGTQTGKSGKAYPYRSALCLETQHFPNSPNTPAFPSTRLNPGETYSHTCVYQFGVRN